MARTFNSPEDRERWEQSAKNRLMDLEQKAAESGKQYYQLKPAVAIGVVDAKLSPTGYRLWLYLCALFPFGGRAETMPTQGELAARLGVRRQAILKAAAELESADLWAFKIEEWKGQNLTGYGAQDRGTLFDTPGTFLNTPDTQKRTPDTQKRTPPFLEPAPEASFEDPECTNRSFKAFKKTIGTETDSLRSIDSDGLGTRLDPSNPYEAEIEELLMLATQAGIKTNSTHSRTIAALRLQRSAAETRLAVEKSVSAVVEQMERGKCKNPGAMFNESLQRAMQGKEFTANGAKGKRKIADQPSLNEASLKVGIALRDGDRKAAIAYLQSLWADGWQDLVEQMLHLFKREWQFSLTSEGVRDAAD